MPFPRKNSDSGDIALTHLHLRFLRVQHRLNMRLEKLFGLHRRVEMTDFIVFYRELWQQSAAALGASFEELSAGLWEVRLNGKATLINIYKVQFDDPVILHLAGDKALCYTLLQRQGLPVPDHMSFRINEFRRAEDFMEAHQGELAVVKPANGTAGSRGITTPVRTIGECRRASALASLYGDEILIEKWVPGEPYRVLVLDEKVIHATRRRGIRVVGDGKSPILQLLGQRIGNRVPWDDSDTAETLRAQGLSIESTLEAGREVLARSSPLSCGKAIERRTVFNENVTELICPEVRALAVKAARILRARFAGVDLITLDPSAPLAETAGAINEINTTPGLHHHYNLINADNAPAVTVLRRLLNIPGGHWKE